MTCTDIDGEQRRAVREGLSESELAVFDLMHEATRPPPSARASSS